MTTQRRIALDLAGRGNHRFLGVVQLATVIGLVIIDSIGIRTFDRPTMQQMLAATAALVVVSIVAAMIPWQRINRHWAILLAVFDLALLAGVRESIVDYQQSIVVLALLPIVWLSFFFEKREVALALAGGYVVAVAPLIGSTSWTPSGADWGTMLLCATTFTVIAIAVHTGAVALRKQSVRLLNARTDLRRARADDADIHSRLRESIASARSSESALNSSVALGADAASAALTMMDTVEAGITFYDESGAVVLANSTALALAKDAQLDDVNGMHKILALVTAGETVTRHAFSVGSGPSQRSLVATARFVLRSTGEHLGTVITTTDVTPLASALRAREEYLHTISEELRTPLTSILGYLEVIDDTIDVDWAGIGPEFATVLRNSNRLLGIVDDLLHTAEAEMPQYRAAVEVPLLSKRASEVTQTDAQAPLVPVVLA